MMVNNNLSPNTKRLGSNNQYLGLPQKRGYAGDRFIPMRAPGNCEDNYELQYQHEE